MTRFNPVRTPEELAAFKARNLAQPAAVVTIKPAKAQAKPSQRQEYTELLAETRQMIAAAKRQNLWQAVPALVQQAETFQELLNNRALA